MDGHAGREGNHVPELNKNMRKQEVPAVSDHSTSPSHFRLYCDTGQVVEKGSQHTCTSGSGSGQRSSFGKTETKL